MNARDADALLERAVAGRAGTWADWGAGSGTFTRALARLLGPGSRIYAVDRDAAAIAGLRNGRRSGGGTAEIVPILADFTGPSAIDGIPDAGLAGMLFANALHFVPDPGAVLAHLAARLAPGGRVVIIEYDGRRANRWVPYPTPVGQLPRIVAAACLATPVITATRPSAYGGTIYTAVAEPLPRSVTPN